MDLDLLKRQNGAGTQILIAFTAILLWDWLALLPTEYTHIWKAGRLTAGRCMYLLNRYGSLILQIISMSMIVTPMSREVCSKIYWIQTLGLIYILFTSDVLFALRVAGLYGNSRRIVAALSLILMTQLGLMVAVGVQLRPVSVPQPIAEYIGARGCLTGAYKGSDLGFVSALSIAPLITSLILLAMTIYRSWKISQELGGTKLPILKRMVRDGLLYFAVISVFNIINLTFWYQSSQPVKSYGVAPLVVMSSVLSCRLVLGLLSDRPKTLALGSLPTLQQSNHGTPSFAGRIRFSQDFSSVPPPPAATQSQIPSQSILAYNLQREPSAGSSASNEQGSNVDAEKEIEGKRQSL